ncbi:hypothetical protein F3Y22_tig00111993pilonHSYRG00078 [Hibiscus syriacus]|uniref:Uncharacterized protein n=1 Tax=Hibiscus syriacus TaxID=106335 RepID=A0A6A2YCX7_HIBSY|nr:hypothetical protein F3Y22_tig00111993pilonHSYRG00078 [Hibiscus syriacus]
MPYLFGASRPFAPYGPRVFGDFRGPAFGMMFPGRAPQPGAVFPSGGMGMVMASSIWGAWDPQMQILLSRWPAHWHASYVSPTSSTNDRFSAGLEQGRGQEMGDLGSGLRNDDNESKDEAPRMSRHGEGKKKRKSLEDDATASDR